MSAKTAALCALLLLAATRVHAHRLDEYLQAATIAVEKGRIHAEIRLVPGVEVFATVFAEIDRDGDGVVSVTERRAYAERVRGDVSLRVDGTPIPLRLLSATFAPTELLQAGRGEIQVRLEANVPGVAPNRRLSFENRHLSRISSYLVNGLVPQDANIRLGAQQRSYDQSFYALDYADATAGADPRGPSSWLEPWDWIDAALPALIMTLALAVRRIRGSRARVR
jgi:hypothetical protein